MHSTDSSDVRPGRRLDSWKAIADYLGRDRTTLMRWERENGLPIRRVPGSSRSVFGYTNEIDAWLAAHPATAGTPAAAAVRRPRWRGAAIAAFLLIAAGAAIALTWKTSVVARVAVEGHALAAFDAGGRRLWEYALPSTSTGVVSAQRILDLDVDGRQDILVTLHHIPGRGDGFGEVIRFDSQGAVAWRRSLDDRYTYDGVEYGPGWYPDDLLVYQSGGAARIAVAFHHHTWWPSVLATFDRDGAVVDRFVNPGWIHHLNITPDGKYLLASGLSNLHHGAMLTVLEAARPRGMVPFDAAAASRCRGCPDGTPVEYLVAPWSDVAQPSNAPSAVVHVTSPGWIELRAPQRRTAELPAAELIVTLSPSLEIVHRNASDGFGDLHRQLERAGEVRHAFAACPWRTPPVRVWTPSRGWQSLK